MEVTIDLFVDLAGELKDGSRGSEKLREQLQSEATTDDIEDLLTEALNGTETYHNRALQDIVNNIGQRLGFSVEYGPYNPSDHPRYDGLWQSSDLESDEVHLIVETKKTAGFQINPAKQPGDYMDQLEKTKGIDKNQVYGLIVVGEDGDEIESVISSVRGSEYRNRIRVITCTRLFTLLSMADEGGLDRRQTAQVLLPMDTVNIGTLVDLIQKIVAGSRRVPDGEFWQRCQEEAGIVKQSNGEITVQTDELADAERLRRVIGIAIDTGHLTADMLPYRAGGDTRAVVNSSPEHPSGTEMNRPREVRDGFYVECNYSSDQIHDKIRQLASEVES